MPQLVPPQPKIILPPPPPPASSALAGASTFTPLFIQVQQRLAQDNDPTQGVVNALGAGVNSVFPSFTVDGPQKSPVACPRPFLVVTSEGKRAHDRLLRESHITVEIHDNPDAGLTRWPGILYRIDQVLIDSQWVPEPDGFNTFLHGFFFVDESPEMLADETYDTQVIMRKVAILGRDRTSGRGHGG